MHPINRGVFSFPHTTHAFPLVYRIAVCQHIVMVLAQVALLDRPTIRMAAGSPLKNTAWHALPGRYWSYALVPNKFKRSTL
jgi:hypothetical protein